MPGTSNKDINSVKSKIILFSWIFFKHFFILQTRILVTHGVHWLPQVDKIVVLVNGIVSEVGNYEELISHDGAFAQFLLTYLNEENEESDPESK